MTITGSEFTAMTPTGPLPWRIRHDPMCLLPSLVPIQIAGTSAAATLDRRLLVQLYQAMVLGRRFNLQAGALARQGRLAVYPSTTGQEATEIAAALALRRQDWLFPTYRDTLAVVIRGVDPVEALTLLRGDKHNGYDPRQHRIAPLCTPLATHLPHAVGLAQAARLCGDDVVALAMVGDGATNEGDFHEALNFAAVWRAPIVFLVQNNGYAISIPVTEQSAAPSLAHKGIGYGMPGILVDGNDVLAVYSVLADAIAKARGEGGPLLVEAVTYRVEAHTNADDATRYRRDEEVERWRRHDPIAVLAAQLADLGMLDDSLRDTAVSNAEEFAADLRRRIDRIGPVDPADMFRHVYTEPTTQLSEQLALVRAELAMEEDDKR